MNRLEYIIQEKRVLIADGATGTMLQKAGLPAGAAPERWNLENPDGVLWLHRGYIDAGSDIILTNTFGGTRYRLERDGLGDKTRAVNMRAAQLAKQAAGNEVLVLGDVGPTGMILEPLGDLSIAEAKDEFAIQAQSLAEGGVDAFLVETMSDLSEVEAAVEGIRLVSALPIITTMSFDTRGRTMMGVKPEQAAKAMVELGVFAMGANCGRTLSETLTAIEKMKEIAPSALLMAKPNAGLPHTDGSELVYDVTPEVMGEYAVKFQEAGVVIFGGCCGSTPDHIRAIAKRLRH